MKLPPVRFKYLTYCGICCLMGVQMARAQQLFPDSTTALPPSMAPASGVSGLLAAPADTTIPAASVADTTIPAASILGDTAVPAASIMADTTAAAPLVDSARPGSSLVDSTGLPFSMDNPHRYVIGGIEVSGSKYLDNSLVASVTGLYKGQVVVLPGDGLSDAIHKLWNQKLFSDVAILVDRIAGDSIYLNLHVTERPRLGNYHFAGVKKTSADELKDKVGLVRGTVITGNTTLSAIDKIKKYYEGKGYRNVAVIITEAPSPGLLNTVDLTFHITRGEKIKVSQIFFSGNSHVSDRKLEKQMKGTKERTRISLHASDDKNAYGAPHRIDFPDYIRHYGFLSFSQTRLLLNPYFRMKLFSSAKFDNTKYQEDKDKVLSYYNTLGYRDALIEADTVYNSPEGGVDVAMKVSEGKKYYFGNISWKGNTQYPDSVLDRLLGIQHGDIYNIELLNKRLGVTPSEQGGDISSLYQDNGYLFYHITPVETSIRGDTIDYEMRMVEGPQADINRITVTGNDKTNEHVVRRELRTIPGEKYSRADVIRSMRQISQLGFFDPQKVTPNIQPNPQDGTVDIGWGVEEKPSDKLNLSAGWGGYYGITGTIGMSFNNFSIRNIFNKKAWRPLPSGDGQTLSVQLQSNGKYYSSYNFSFTEPWLGGKKHNPFTISYYHNKFSNPSYEGYIPIFNDTSYLKTTGISVSYGKQLKWPDDFFSLSFQLSYERYKLRSYFNDPIFTPSGLTTGVSNNIYLRITLERNSTDQPLFPTRGSHFTFYGQFTPPYSAFEQDKDYDHLTPQQKFRFIEYQKYRFTGQWFFPIGQPSGKDHKTFVLHLAAKMGIVGRYNPNVPLSPFERFELGGDGISNYIYYGKDIISQRGYPVYYTSDPTVNPDNQNPPTGYQGFTMFSKYTLELRYPISLNPSSTIYALTFLDAANGYNGFKDFDPFRLRRDVGIGMRFFLPMFGLLGFDYGVGLDRLRQGGGLKNATKFSFMLGYEPD